MNFLRTLKDTITTAKFKDFVAVLNRILFVVVMYSAFIDRNMYTTYAM